MPRQSRPCLRANYRVNRMRKRRLNGHAAARSRGILQSPSNCAPSFSTRLGVVKVHRRRAVGNNSTRSRAITSPVTLPPIVSRTAAMRAVTMAPGAIRISSPVISPSASPSILAGSLKFNLPDTRVPLLMQDSKPFGCADIEARPCCDLVSSNSAVKPRTTQCPASAFFHCRRFNVSYLGQPSGEVSCVTQ